MIGFLHVRSDVLKKRGDPCNVVAACVYGVFIAVSDVDNGIAGTL